MMQSMLRHLADGVEYGVVKQLVELRLKWLEQHRPGQLIFNGFLEHIKKVADQMADICRILKRDYNFRALNVPSRSVSAACEGLAQRTTAVPNAPTRDKVKAKHWPVGTLAVLLLMTAEQGRHGLGTYPAVQSAAAASLGGHSRQAAVPMSARQMRRYYDI